jgi:hypothetical protein
MRVVVNFMLRIPYRFVLPVLIVILSAALGFEGRRQQQGIDLGSWDGPPPRSLEIAMALNIPAAIAAIPGGLLLELVTGSFGRARRAEWQDVVGYFYLAVFVFGQWFGIGRWFDRRWGVLYMSSALSRPRGSKIVHAAALIGALFFVCFGILHMLHSGWMSSWIPGAGLTAWGSIAAIVVILRLRRLVPSVEGDTPRQSQ